MKTKLASLTILTALMIPVAAGAADMPLKAPPPPPPPPFSWTGFYFGGEAGGAFANGTISDSLFGLSVSSNHSGFLGGGDVGYNYQASNIVFGIEGNFDWTSLNATGNGFPTRLGTLQGSASTDWITTAAGRLGITADRLFYGGGGGSGAVLFYVKGGGGWVKNSATITNLSNGNSVSASNNNSGWLVGGGIEWAFTQNWSAKIEYDYLGLRSFSWNSVLFPGETFNASRNIQMLKAGINYRFNWGSPVVARY
jgi:outer membrane immunogenic protein